MEALEQLTLFTEASLNLAKTCQSQASKRDCPVSAPASGSRCLELFPNSDPVMLLLRTCVERSISPSIPSCPVWRMKATKSGASSYLHLRLVPTTLARDSSWLPGDGTLLPTLTRCGNWNRRGASATSGDGLFSVLGRTPSADFLEWFMGFPAGWLQETP